MQKVQDTSDTREVTWAVILAPARGKDETYEQYKQRRKIGNYLLKIRNYGRWFWNSAEQGTYRKNKNG